MEQTDKEYIDSIMTSYIRNNFKLNRYQIKKRLGFKADDDTISELQQYYYVWIYTHLDASKMPRGHEDSSIGQIFSKLLNHPSAFRMRDLFNRRTCGFSTDEEWKNLIEFTPAEEPVEHFTNGHLNADETDDKKRELFDTAKRETAEWIEDHPDSKLAIAMRNTAKKWTKGKKRAKPLTEKQVMERLTDYVAAPNIRFHRVVTGATVEQELIESFRREFASLWDINNGEPVKNSQLPRAGW